MGQKKSRMLSIYRRDQAEAVTPKIPAPMVCQAEAVTLEILTPEVCHCLCSLPSDAASSFFYSARIAELSEQRSNFENQLDFNVESSTSHWTTVTAATSKSDERNEQVPNRVVFEKLKEHPEWGPFFRRHYELEIGDKIAEGGQGEIYEALGMSKDDWRCKGNAKVSLVVKVFKEGFPVNELQTLWPPGIASIASPHKVHGGERYWKLYRKNNGEGFLCWALGAQVLQDERFAFIFDRYDGDLRKLIDENMLQRNGCPPFSSVKTHTCIYSIALGMCRLHELGILHNDLKAANVLVNNGTTYYNLVQCGVADFGVADFESSIGIEGTGFWRAPEILLALKNRKLHQETFKQCTTQESDVYSFAMTCYEIITGRMPFEDHNVQDYDIVLRGERPTLPSYPFARYNNLVKRCWHEDPQQRPSFTQIVDNLEYIDFQYLNLPYCEFRYDDYFIRDE